MLKTRCKVFSVSLARAALFTTQALIISICALPLATGVSFFISHAHAQTAVKTEKITATIALPGVQVESLNPYAHSTTQIYPTWKHVIEPLFEWSWSKRQLVPILAES
ncbi:MAG TPA: hypothetical protein VFY96_10275, partial [Candidatus Binatia bacterium]|nr:hypothetical protein [Candidatus Binatia bacterium]